MPNTFVKNKKIEHLWSILSASSSVDQQTNSLSIFNVVEEINITIPPTEKINNSNETVLSQTLSVPLNLTITSFWQRNDDEKDREDISVDARVEFIDPEGKVIHQNPIVLNFKKEFKRLRTITIINAINFTDKGQYRFSIKAFADKKGIFEEVSSIPVDIKIEKKPPVG